MITEVKLPQYGLGMSEGTVVAWLRREGERVEKDDLLVEIEAAKTTVEVPAPAAGVLKLILTQPGETVPIARLWQLSKHWFDRRQSPDWRKPPREVLQEMLRDHGFTGQFWSLT